MKIIIDVNEEGKIGMSIEGEVRVGELVGILELTKHIVLTKDFDADTDEQVQEEQ